MLNILALLGLPTVLIGQVAGGKGMKSSVNATLSDVTNTVFYIRLFLIGASIIAICAICFWLIKTLRARARKKAVADVIAQLDILQTTCFQLKAKKTNKADILAAKTDTTTALLETLATKDITRLFGCDMQKQMIASIQIVHDDQIPVSEQSIVADRWLRSIDILLR